MMTIVGIRETNFKSKDGAEICGVTLYTTEPADKVEGVATDKLFLGEKLGFKASDFNPGDNILPIYNKYGKIAGIQFCD